MIYVNAINVSVQNEIPGKGNIIQLNFGINLSFQGSRLPRFNSENWHTYHFSSKQQFTTTLRRYQAFGENYDEQYHRITTNLNGKSIDIYLVLFLRISMIQTDMPFESKCLNFLVRLAFVMTNDHQQSIWVNRYR